MSGLDNMEKKAMIGAILCIGAVVLLGLTFMMPWYSVQMDGSGEYQGSSYSVDGQVDAYFDHTETDTKVTVEGQEMMDEHESDDYNESADTANVFSNTRIFTVIAMIGSSLGVVGAVLVSVGKLDKKIGTVLILIGLIFAIVTPIYLYFELPSAMENEMDDSGNLGGDLSGMGDSFFGSDNITYEGIEMDVNWGGSTSWYMTFIAAALNGVGMALVLLSEPGKKDIRQRYPQEPRQQPPQQQQRYDQQQGPRQQPPQQQQQGYGEQQQPNQKQEFSGEKDYFGEESTDNSRDQKNTY